MKQIKVKTASDHKNIRIQYAALPWRYSKQEGLEILLATSRETRRWVIPKGWPMKGRKPHITAALEAMQEAGLHGKIERKKIGDYRYNKRLKSDLAVTCLVDVFPLQVLRQRNKWREQNQRIIHWFPFKIAAAQVDEIDLRDLILAFGATKLFKEISS
ncbi:MAG: NUDIX hydrolase [Methylocystaceae bacterium]|nr:NUDIX hydrolase [Methylocystaceae bacterium]